MWILTTLLVANTSPLVPCEALLEKGEPRRAEDCFADQAKRFDRAGSAESIVAHHGRARALLVRGSRIRAQAAINTVIDRWSKTTKSARRTPRYRRAAALAYWYRAREPYDDFLRIKSLDKKRTVAAQLAERYEAIARIGDVQTMLRAHQRIAEVWLTLARAEPDGCQRRSSVHHAERSLDAVLHHPDTTTGLDKRATATQKQLSAVRIDCRTR